MSSQYFISLQYYSTCFGFSYNHHQEYKKLQSQTLVRSYILVSWEEWKVKTVKKYSLDRQLVHSNVARLAWPRWNEVATYPANTF
jgi:hypothetical protein